ncbi:hypothetical protein CFC21_096633, partial [Triticum aestivum]
SSSS